MGRDPRRQGSIPSLLDHSPAQAIVIIVEYRSLAGRHSALGLGKAHAAAAPMDVGDPAILKGLTMA